MEGGDVGHKLERGQRKSHPNQIWVGLILFSNFREKAVHEEQVRNVTLIKFEVELVQPWNTAWTTYDT